jgi:glycosyltransferase involved in cell wall biosynthesis
MKVLSIYYKHKRGGFNRRLYQLYRALAERDHRIHYIAASPFPVSHPHIDAHILPIAFLRKENPVFWICFLMAAPLWCLGVACKYNIDKIIVFSGFYAAICSPAAVILRRPMIVFLRADVVKESRQEGKSSLKIALHRMLERLGLRFASLVVANSRTLRRSISARQGRLRLDVLPNNIPKPNPLTTAQKQRIRSRYRLTADQFVVTTAAPHNRVKNIDFLILAFSRISAPHARLVLIGDDPTGGGETKRLERLVRDLGLQSRVVFTGWLDDSIQTVAAADLFVTSSTQEGSPNALLEALACDIPCLGSRIPEIKEILGAEELLFDLKSPTELACKIERAAEDNIYLSELKRLADQQKKAYTFDWDQAVTALVGRAGC